MSRMDELSVPFATVLTGPPANGFTLAPTYSPG